jgi:hypothetical protein
MSRWIARADVRVVLAVLLAAVCLSSAETLPEYLTDRGFWTLVNELSEPSREVRISNVVSNERAFQSVIPELLRATVRKRAFVGVGPEQNFTYIAALEPSIAFIVDIRRGNLAEHLLYKALFELAGDRAEFLSLLLSRPRPRGLGPSTGAADLLAAYSSPAGDWPLYDRTSRAVRAHLVATHGFALSAEDLRAIDEAHRSFYWLGTRLRYGARVPPPFVGETGKVDSSPLGMPIGINGASNQPTFAELMTGADAHGVAHGFLASERAFNVVKDLEARNLIVPIVGDFAGPTAIRAVAAYLKQKGALVSAFYLSNVEEYLRREGSWPAACANLAMLPIDDASVFVRSRERRTPKGAEGFTMEIARMAGMGNCRAPQAPQAPQAPPRFLSIARSACSRSNSTSE